MIGAEKGKIALFVCNDLMGILFANKVLPEIKNMGFDPVIINTGTNRNRQFKIPTPPIVAFYNATLPGQTLIPTLEDQPLDITSPNHTYRQLSLLHNVEYVEVENINDPAFVSKIADENYHGGLAMRFLQLFEPELIGVFREKGFLWNLHSGLLPDYKGLLIPFRAIENGEKEYGLTLHELTGGIDQGAIIAKGVIPLDRTKPVLDLYLDAVPVGTELLLTSLNAVKEGQPIPAIEQTAVAKSYYPNPTSQEFAKYAQNGICYADMDTATQRIAHLFANEGTLLHLRLKRKIEDAVNLYIESSSSKISLTTTSSGIQVQAP